MKKWKFGKIESKVEGKFEFWKVWKKLGSKKLGVKVKIELNKLIIKLLQ